MRLHWLFAIDPSARRRAIVPHNLAYKIAARRFAAFPAAAKNCIHQQLDAVRHHRVAVIINAARRLENAPHLRQANAHINQIRLPTAAVNRVKRINQRERRRILLAESVFLVRMRVGQFPSVLKRGERLPPARLHGVFPLLAGVERRVKINQVRRFGIHPPKNRQIVPRVYPANERIFWHRRDYNPFRANRRRSAATAGVICRC